VNNGPAPLRARRFALSADSTRVTLLDGFAWAVWSPGDGTVSEWNRPVRGLQLDYLSGDTGLSADGRFYYVYWDDYLAIDTMENRVLRQHSIALHPQTTAISQNGEMLAIGGEEGEFVAVNAAGETTFQETPGHGPIVNVSVGADGSLASFVDSEGRCGVVDLRAGRLLVEPDALRQSLG
jgi:hypothetical protein